MWPDDTWLGDVRLVLRDRVVPRGAVRVEGGVVAEVVEGTARGAVTSGEGLTLMPGIVDLHGDMIEKEVEPRPDCDFPLDVAVLNLDARLAAAGVTTAFAGVSFAEGKRGPRSEDRARATVEAVARAKPRARVDLRVHARFEITNPRAEPILRDLLERGMVDMVSLTDHTPGQGQYRDVEQYVAYASRTSGATPEEAAARAARRMAAPPAWEVAQRVTELARAQGLPIASHDDDTPAKVALMRGLGATISEFPVTLEGARAAREHGMATLMGAPNALRGRSMTGNVTARDVLEAGLLDALAADYHQGAMLPAVVAWVREGRVPLHAAVALLTCNPADAAGLRDRGEIAVGRRADLMLVDVSDAPGAEGDAPPPRVRAVWREGRMIHSDGWAAPAAASLAVAA